ncbi:two-pore potassium channel 1-like isoform X2 [Macadamia integrifolia]|uniref:two-pore potassium channel 1-like isoform X2 n=1 Tax=Macadamia integrifolia TaxID=60698 RepID=UPI001C52A196|nr:two-pore potassium channel 1-like isoform X2 [Macadamia integrifolia]
MANSDGKKQSLLVGLLDPSPEPNRKQTTKKGRFRRCTSAPPLDFPQSEKNGGGGSLPRSQFILGDLHPSFVQVASLLTIYLGVGAICFFLVRNQIGGEKTNGVLDAVYFCIVTMTTVGYGDLVPNTKLTKLLACAFVFSGMALIGLILSKAADYLVEKQEILLVKTLHMHHNVGASEIVKELQTNKLKYKFVVILIVLLLLILVGTIFLYRVEKLDLVDAFYCVCSTITTLGYGDKSFSTETGRVFAVFWILTSTICLAQFFLCLAELNTERRQHVLVDWVINRRTTSTDLEAADLDHDGVVRAAEFVIYKLKEMGKIKEEDIALVMEEFEDLDVDQSGTLSVSDLMLAQSSQTAISDRFRSI